MFHSFRATRRMQSSLAWIPLFTLLLGHQVSSRFLDESCGKFMEQSRAGLQAAAWMTAVSNASDFLCGGTLIHKRFVLTAAQCIEHQVNLFVELGAYNIPDADSQESRIPIIKAVVHRLFSRSPVQNDIALLKMPYSVVFSADIHPICIISDERIKNFVESTRTFNGFAWAPKSQGLDSENLHVLIFNKLNETECSINHSSNDICARVLDGNTTGVYVGNPLTKSFMISGNNTKIKREVQLGIASFRNPNSKGPIVFTDVTSHVDWIATNVNRLNLEDTTPSGPQEPESPSGNVSSQSASKPDLWLFKDCGGDTITSHQMALVLGINFKANGVFITENFIITIARGMPEEVNVIPLAIDNSVYHPVSVETVFKHPEYSGDNKNDIALLKVKLPEDMRNYFTEGFKPICMLLKKSHQLNAETSPPFTRFVPEQRGNLILSTEHSVELISAEECAKQIHWTIEQNQLCVADSTGIINPNELNGEVLGKMLMYSAKKWVALFGILSYSTSNVHVYTNVMRHTDWIAQTVASNL